MSRPHATLDKAASAWKRRARFDGRAKWLGGGWWQVGSSRPTQGLARWLLARGLVVAVGGGFELRDPEYMKSRDSEAGDGE